MSCIYMIYTRICFVYVNIAVYTMYILCIYMVYTRICFVYVDIAVYTMYIPCIYHVYTWYIQVYPLDILDISLAYHYKKGTEQTHEV